DLRGLRRDGKTRQRREVRFLPGQGFEFPLLTLRFFVCPTASRVARDRFDASRPGGNRSFLHNPTRPDLRCRSYVGAAAKFHRIAIQFLRIAADLENPDSVAVFLAKELLDLLSLSRLLVWNFHPRNAFVLGDLVIHQPFDIALLLQSER